MKNSTRKLLLTGAAVLTLCLGGYLAAANVMLRSGWLLRLINRHPEHFALHYDSAWTVLPGVVHLERVQLVGQARTSQWWAGIDSATIAIDLPRLLRRELVASSLTASGVAFRLRRRPEQTAAPGAGAPGKPGGAGEAASSHGGIAATAAGTGPRPDLAWHPAEPPPQVPVIPGLVNTTAPPPPSGPEDERGRWRIRLAGVTLERVREVWIAGYRFAGQARVQGGFDMENAHRFTLDSATADLRSGALQVSDRPLLDGMTGAVRFELPPIDPIDLQGGFLPLASGSVRLRGRMQGLGFLEPYVAAVPWIELGGDAGTFEASLDVRHGMYLPGAHVAARPGSVTARLLDDVATGRCQVTWDVAADRGGPVGRLVAAFDQFQLGREGAGEKRAQGRGLRVEIATRDLRVAALPVPTAVAVDLPPTAISDFSSYNRNLPRGAGIQLAGGTGVVSASLRAAAPAWAATGGINLRGRAVEVMLPGAHLRGNLAAQSRFRALLLQRRLLLTESDVALTDVQRLDGGDRDRGAGGGGGGWWARVHLDYLSVARTGQVELQARMRSTLSDTRPLLALFAPRPKPLLGWLDRLLDLHPIDASGELAMARGSIAIDGLTITAGKANIRARLRFAGGRDDGVLYAAYGPLSVGIQLRQGQRSWKLVGARKWFESQGGAGAAPAPLLQSPGRQITHVTVRDAAPGS
jgi:hypothetical protein